MSETLLLDETEIRELRERHYNATLDEVIEIHEDLRILRVRPDAGVPRFRPGQYTSLGLGYWEPRVEGVQQEELDERRIRRVPRRAYSVSCALLDGQGRLMRADEFPFLEFYVALVRQAEKHAPALTPRLFALEAGSRLFVEESLHGSYSLDQVGPTDDVVFAATGTGEAPHNAMLAELLTRGQTGRIVCVTGVRRRRDLAYESVLRELERRYANFRYLTLTTREPENLDADAPGYVGKQYIQGYVQSGAFERESGVALDPQKVHVFLCGNPDMIGVPVKVPGTDQRQPQPGGMIDMLQQRGFRADEPSRPGNVHFERYW